MSNYRIPGVIINERKAFEDVVPPVPTAVPVFIGFTQKAEGIYGESFHMQSVKVSSLKEYVDIFGGQMSYQYDLKPTDNDNEFDVNLRDTGKFNLVLDKKTASYMYDSLRMFFLNGGSLCHVISAGNVATKDKKKSIIDCIDILENEKEPTLVLVPDAILLGEKDCYEIYTKVLMHCADKNNNRFAIFDVPEKDKPTGNTLDEKIDLKKFHDNMEKIYNEDSSQDQSMGYLTYGAAYFPRLNTNLYTPGEVSYKNIKNYSKQSPILFGSGDSTKLNGSGGGGGTAVLTRTEAKVEKRKRAQSVNYNRVLKAITTKVNIQPTCGALAGVYAKSDRINGVHYAPANVSLVGVISPYIQITNKDHEKLIDEQKGYYVNVLRSFPNRGTVVWGARTLDSLDLDWKYINVRRTVSVIQRSIKKAVDGYLFKPNNQQTWIKIRSVINNYLTTMWKNGALMGNSAENAYNVSVGLGSTMTSEDILNGIIKVSVLIAVVRPAEYIEVTFQQTMGEGLLEGESSGDGEGDGEGGGDDGGKETAPDTPAPK